MASTDFVVDVPILAANRIFGRVEKADGLLVVVVVINTLSTYAVRRIRDLVPLVSQRGAQ